MRKRRRSADEATTLPAPVSMDTIHLAFTEFREIASRTWDLEDCYINPQNRASPLETRYATLANLFTELNSKAQHKQSNFPLLTRLNQNITVKVATHIYPNGIKTVAFKSVNLGQVTKEIENYINIISHPRESLQQQLVVYYLQRQHMIFKAQAKPRSFAGVLTPAQQQTFLPLLKQSALFKCLLKHRAYLLSDAFSSLVGFYLLKQDISPENIGKAIMFAFIGKDMPLQVQDEIASELSDFLNFELLGGLKDLLSTVVIDSRIKAHVFLLPDMPDTALLPPVKREISAPPADRKLTPFVDDISSEAGSAQFIARIKADLLQLIAGLRSRNTFPWTENCILLCAALVHYINLGKLPDKLDIDRPSTVEDYALGVDYSPIVVKKEADSKSPRAVPTKLTQPARAVLTQRNELLNRAVDAGLPYREDYRDEKFVTRRLDRDPGKEAVALHLTKTALLLDGIETTDAVPDAVQEKVAVTDLDSRLKECAQQSPTRFFATLVIMCRVLKEGQPEQPNHAVIALATVYHVVYCDAQKFTRAHPERTFSSAFSLKDFIGNRRTLAPRGENFGNSVFLDPTGYTYKEFETARQSSTSPRL